MSTTTHAPRTYTAADALVEAEIHAAQIELRCIRAELQDAVREFDTARDRDEIAAIRRAMSDLALILPARAPARRALLDRLFGSTAPVATSAPETASQTGWAHR